MWTKIFEFSIILFSVDNYIYYGTRYVVTLGLSIEIVVQKGCICLGISCLHKIGIKSYYLLLLLLQWGNCDGDDGNSGFKKTDNNAEVVNDIKVIILPFNFSVFPYNLH